MICGQKKKGGAIHPSLRSDAPSRRRTGPSSKPRRTSPQPPPAKLPLPTNAHITPSERETATSFSPRYLHVPSHKAPLQQKTSTPRPASPRFDT
ncbi:hypothetical protein K505DRAFT_329551 [Melanomma pulvis-pyrius CBS 109.77]|uniref:Uncharacterized protein n=1 Tax=Melanomma pulvis-pyrius CBS 109.77 TaxID=1314802 RepID=A0A6A6WUP5_9PLEO|nr:hypothetical protein K505DRAFT_329551 [Melanomma pulvis-pyrius CBS 109.77]